MWRPQYPFSGYRLVACGSACDGEVGRQALRSCSICCCHLIFQLTYDGTQIKKIMAGGGGGFQATKKTSGYATEYNAHSEPLIKELKLLKLEDIRKLQELKFYYKLVHKQLPCYFNCISVTTINTVHQHNTRQSGNLYSDRVKHDFAKRCIRFSVIVTVNKTNTSIKSKIFTHSIYGFAHYTKDRILQNYV